MSDFASLSMIGIRETLDEKTRKFEGDGTPFLFVPNLTKVEAVTVGNTNVPLVEERRYVEDATGRETAPIPRPLISLDETPDGRKVLLRSKLSNDGIWQKGVQIFVTGVWADDPSTKTKSKKAKEPSENEPVE